MRLNRAILNPRLGNLGPGREQSTRPLLGNGGETSVPRLKSRTARVGVALLLLIAMTLGWAADGPGPDGSGTPAVPPETTAPRSPAADPPSADQALASAPAGDTVAKPAVEIAAAIRTGKVIKDMTMEQVMQSRGAPDRKEVIPPDAELWHYPAGEVAFSAGKVSYVSLAPKSEPPLVILKKYAPTQGPVTQHRPTQGASTQAAAPQIRTGDSYIYESTDLEQPGISISTRRTVTSTKGKVILSSINLDNKNAKARNLWFDREWNLIATRNADNSGLDYSPPLKYYDFPLFPGKTWQQDTTETNTKTGTVKSHSVAGVVGQWETVSVPAGTFRAIKVELQTEVFDHSTGERISGSDRSWFVPDVRRSVKSITTGKGGSQRLIQLMSYELAPGS